MAETLDQTTLTKVVRKYWSSLTPFYNSIPKRTILGDKAGWDVLTASRTRATHRRVGRPAGKIALVARDYKTSKLAYFRESKALPPDVKNWLRRPGTEDQRYGEALVADELFDLTKIVLQGAESDIFNMCTGTLTVTGEEVNFTIDYDVSATHKPTVPTSWADPTADIIGDLEDFGGLIEDDAGLERGNLLISRTTKKRMLANEVVQNLLRTQYGYEMATSGNLPPELCGWVPMLYNAGDSNSGSYAKYLDDGHVLGLAKSPEIWELQVGPSGDENAKGAPGLFAKSYVQEDPSGEFLVVDHHCLPVLSIPDGVVYADIVP